MAGNEQARHVDSADATTHIVSIENCLSKKLLAATHFYGRSDFSWSDWRHESHAISFEKIDFLLIIFREQVVQKLFALWPNSRDVVTKFVPHYFVLLRHVS